MADSTEKELLARIQPRYCWKTFQKKNLENILIGNFEEKLLDENINNFLQKKEFPDCVFCSSDLIAARFIHIARERGLKIPQDIKVLGFDNLDLSSYIGLSTVNQNLDMSGRVAAELILNRMKDPGRSCVNMNLPLDIIIRETTGHL